MAATKAQINWTAVSRGSTNITRVTAASFGQGGSLIKGSSGGSARRG